MGYRPVGVYPNPIRTTISHLASILKARNIYQPGGVSYCFDTSRAGREMIPKPLDTRRAEYSLGGEPDGLPGAYLPYLSYRISPIYPTLPIVYTTGQGDIV